MTATTQTQTWRIDPAHTSATIAARHLMLTTVRASLSGVTGELRFDPERPEQASIRLAIPAATVNSGDPKRDGHLRSADFLDVERHPEITFQSTNVRKADDRFIVTGDLTIRGTTKPVDVAVEPNGVVQGMNGRVAGFTASATVDRTAFGLVWNMPVPGGVLVSEKLKVEFDLQAVETAAAKSGGAAA